MAGQKYPMGGHLIDPPKECPYRKGPFTDGGVWTDLGCCISCCTNHCERYNWFKRAGSRQRNQDLINRGCKNITVSGEVDNGV